MAKTWYHGGSSERLVFDEQQWDRDRTTSSVNEEGPGIYFTDDYAQAATYGPYVLAAELSPSFRLVPSRKPRLSDLTQLYEFAPEESQEIFLSNWGEFVKPAEALGHYANQDTLHDALQSLYGDLYRFDAEEYLSSLRAMDYDGVIVPKSYDRQHLIVWSPRKLEDVRIEDPPYEENPNDDLVQRLKSI